MMALKVAELNSVGEVVYGVQPIPFRWVDTRTMEARYWDPTGNEWVSLEELTHREATKLGVMP